MYEVFKYVAFVLMVSLLAGNSYALDPPKITCVSLDSNNNLILNWNPPLDTNSEFTNYVIYYQDGNGNPFNQIATVTSYGQTQEVIIGNFADDVAFYMVAVSDGGLTTSLSSDTVSPLLISLDVEEKEVEITWTDLALYSPDSIYRVYRSVNDDSWNFRGSVDFGVEEFIDFVELCSAEVKYRIEIRGRGGCLSVSNIATESIDDNIAPNQTNLFCASVDTLDGSVNLAWERTNSGDGFGYLVSHIKDILGLDTVYGRNNLTYNYNQSGINALLQPETLSVAPFDSCFDSVVNWYNQAADSLRFQTLFVDSIFYDRCEGKIGLQWNMPKLGFPVGVRFPSEYQIFRRENNGPAELRGTVTPEDSIFLDSGLVKGSTYKYTVAVLDGVHLKRAISSTFEITVKPPNAPDYLYISSIQNNHETEENVVHVFTDTTSETTKYGLLRSLYFGDQFQLVNTTNKTSNSQFSITDPTGTAGQSSFLYKVVAYDYCEDSIYASAESKSIWIGGYSNDQSFINDLEWSEYLGFENAQSSVGSQQLVRVTSSIVYDTIHTFRSEFSILDTVYTLSYIGGEVCYFIEAIEMDTNIFGLKETSISNMACLTYEPKVFVPNAFTPDDDGINEVFLPDVNFIEPTGYTLSIYDRAGHLIYITIDPTEGWSGAGSPVGVYAYFLELKNARDESLNLRGKVSLIR